VDFVKICNVCSRKAIIKAVKGIIDSNKMCHSNSDLILASLFLEHSVFNCWQLSSEITIDSCTCMRNYTGLSFGHIIHYISMIVFTVSTFAS